MIIEKIVSYRVSDGTQFETREEAEEYELELIQKEIQPEDLKMWDVDKKLIENTNINDAYYVYVGTLKAAEYLYNLGEYLSISTPMDKEYGRLNTGYFYYTNRLGWISYEEDKEEFNNKWDSIAQ